MSDRLYVGPIYVKKSPVHGYGVFAAKDLAADEVIEECYVLSCKNANNPFINYAFDWRGQSAIPLGFGCIYNHSNTPNVDFSLDLDRDLMFFKTRAPIREGEELFSSYGKHWFDDRKLKMRSNSRFRRFYHRGGRLLLRASLVIFCVFAGIYGLRYFLV